MLFLASPGVGAVESGRIIGTYVEILVGGERRFDRVVGTGRRGRGLGYCEAGIGIGGGVVDAVVDVSGSGWGMVIGTGNECFRFDCEGGIGRGGGWREL